MRKTLLISEPITIGHRPEWISKITAEAIARNYRVVLYVETESIEHIVYSALRKRFPDEFSVHSIPSSIEKNKSDFSKYIRHNKLYQQYSLWSFHKKVFHTCQSHDNPDYILVLTFDGLLAAIAFFGAPFQDKAFLTLTMRQNFHYKQLCIPQKKMSLLSYFNTLVSKYLFRICLARIPANAHILSIDEYLVSYFRQLRSKYRHKISYMPDYPNMTLSSTVPFEFSEYGRLNDFSTVILVYGYIQPAKGIEQLLNAIKSKPEICVIIAGIQDLGAQKLLSSQKYRDLHQNGRIVQLNRRLKNNEEHAIFLACDIVWIAYSSPNSSSGVLAQASLCKKPSLVSKYGVVSRKVQEFNIGSAVDIDSTQSIHEGISEIREKHWDDAFDEFNNAHSASKAMEVLFNSLENLDQSD